MVTEIGNHNKKCGVHAIFPLVRFLCKWSCLDCICSHPFWPLHHRNYWSQPHTKTPINYNSDIKLTQYISSFIVVWSQIPNGLGTFFGLAQLILYATYYKSTQRQIAERKGREVNLSEVTIDDEPKKMGNRTTQNGRAPGNHAAWWTPPSNRWNHQRNRSFILIKSPPPLSFSFPMHSSEDDGTCTCITFGNVRGSYLSYRRKPRDTSKLDVCTLLPLWEMWFTIWL